LEWLYILRGYNDDLPSAYISYEICSIDDKMYIEYGYMKYIEVEPSLEEVITYYAYGGQDAK
jgi:hypothetical protein